MHVQLGKRYRDSLTGFAGVATSRSEYLYGCVRVCLEKSVEGKPEEFFFDEQRLVAVEDDVAVTTTARTGGSRPAVPRTGVRR